jgi:hypothetical protein
VPPSCQTRCHRFCKRSPVKKQYITHKITLTCNWVLIGIKRFTTYFSTHNKGSQVQPKLGEIYYKGLLHPTAKTGATGSGNSVPPSLPDRRDTEAETHWSRCHRDMETGSTGFWQTEQINKISIDIFSPPLSTITQNGPGGLWLLLMVLLHHHLEAVAQIGSEAQKMVVAGWRIVRRHSLIWIDWAK